MPIVKTLPSNSDLLKSGQIDQETFNILEWAHQDHWEYTVLRSVLRLYFGARPIEAVLELGVGDGGTFIGWESLASPEATIMGVSEGTNCIVKERIDGHKKSNQKTVLWIGRTENGDTKEKVKEIFPNGIDLLHIDAGHTTKECEHDWNTYAPLVRDMGAVIFHDINDDINGWRVRAVWEQVRKRYNHTFEIRHAMGTGVLFRGIKNNGEIVPKLEPFQ